MKFGYARVSTHQQDLSLQLDALEKAGCETIFQEKVTGATKERPELQNLLVQLRKGDTLIIWKLDRLGRSVRDLIELVTQLQDRGVEFQSLNDHIDTSTPQGKLTFHLFAALAEFERAIISERTKAGLVAARARGRKGGRPKGLSKIMQQKAIIAESYYQQGELSVKEMCEDLQISRSTFYRLLRFRGVPIATK
jgi:DNA invertase Pin-like site-specific DNA recombinase